MRDVASAHIDGADAEDDVRAAVDVVLEADLGSEDAQFVVDQAEGHELAWYATQEIGPGARTALSRSRSRRRLGATASHLHALDGRRR